MSHLPYPSSGGGNPVSIPDPDECWRQSRLGAHHQQQQQQQQPGYPQPYPPSTGFPSAHPYPNGQPNSYPPQNTGYPPQPSGYPTQNTSYPPQPSGHPPQPTGYPPQPSGYPPQPSGYPPQPSGYPPQNTSYPPQSSGYPPQPSGYPPQPASYPPQPSVYPPHPTAYPPQNTNYPPLHGGHPAGCPPGASTSPPYPSVPPPEVCGGGGGHDFSYPAPITQWPANVSPEGQRRVEGNQGLRSDLVSGLRNMMADTIENFDIVAWRNPSPERRSRYPSVHPASRPAPRPASGQAPAPSKADRDQVSPMKVVDFIPGQNYDKLQRSLRGSGRLFEDGEFRPSSRLLTDHAEGGNYVISYYGRKMQMSGNQIEWLRPKEICQRQNSNKEARLFVEKFSRFDINQGEIGDCWFLAALANLAEDKQAFRQVVPANEEFTSSNYCGLFRFRFYRFGEWVEVVIDDRLPTRNGKLIYLKSTEGNEFWSALLEKAYAKLYGSYRALEGGLTIEAAVDFTGGIPEMIDLNKLSSKEELFYYMERADSNNAFMSCSLSNSRYQAEGQRLGLQARHAYTITKVVEIRCAGVRGSIPLIRMRNPHGNSREWTGDWSDNNNLWRSVDASIKRDLELEVKDDGEFYMNFNRDFVKYFGEVEIVHQSAGNLGKREQGERSEASFDLYHFSGRWSRSLGTAGGCGNDSIRSFAENPQFIFTVNDPDPSSPHQKCPVVIALAQNPKERKEEKAIGFRVYKIEPPGTPVDANFLMHNRHIAKPEQYINLREISLRLSLGEGEYVVIPSAFAKGDEGEFLLRLFIDDQWGSSLDGVKQKSGGGIGGGGSAGNDRRQQSGGGGGDPRRRRDHNVRSVGGFTSKIVHRIPIQILNERSDGPEQGEGLLNMMTRSAKKAVWEKIRKKQPKFIDFLKEFYSWANDRESEMTLLQMIMKAIKQQRLQ